MALALPWLESLEPPARSQTLAPRRRFVGIYFPSGAVTSWRPIGTGTGDAWQPSSVMAPLLPVKPFATVLTNVGNNGPFGGHIEPAGCNYTGAFLTCTKPTLGPFTDGANPPPPPVTCGISVDQVLANAIGAMTPIASLQLGLSTLDSYCDGLPCQCSRSISWSSPTQPMYKVVNPQKVFDQLAGAAGNVSANASRWAADKSVLDYVLGHAASVQARLSVSDRARMDQFMTSVRTVETNIQTQTQSMSCSLGPRPPEAYEDMMVPPDYNRDVHANIMIDLMVMAMQCDLTRVISHMMDDARSDFVYDFLNVRHFTPGGSTLTSALVGNSYGEHEAGNDNDGYATINYWMVEKLTRLCQKMIAIDEGPNGSMLDQSVVFMSSEYHGGNEDGLDLPLIIVGSGGGRLTVDQHIDFATTTRGSEELGNLYLTFLQKVFDLPVATFGTGLPQYPAGNLPPPGFRVVPEILA